MTINALDPAFTGSLTINGGAGADTVVFNAKTGSGTYTFNGGGGTDSVVASRDANFTLSSTSLQVGADVLALSSVEAADLTGGASANVFTTGAFGTGSVNLTGQAGNDTYVFASNAAGTFFLDETGGGVDTMDFSAKTSGITLDLSKVSAQEIDSGLTVTLSAVNDFENAVGTPGTDTIAGNELDNGSPAVRATTP